MKSQCYIVLFQCYTRAPIPDVSHCMPNPRLYIRQYSVGRHLYKETLSVILIIRNYWMELALIWRIRPEWMTPQISRTFGWPTLQSRRDYLKCMLVFKSLHAYLLKEFSQSRDFHSYNTCHRYQGSFRFSRAKIWNMLPLALRSELDNKFAFVLNKHFRSEPNWASRSFVILSCTIFYLYLSCVVVFSFSSGRGRAPLAKYCLK